MSTLLKTATGSVYEVDEDLHLVRRLLGGDRPGSAHFHKTSPKWQSYELASEFKVGSSVLFAWNEVGKRFGQRGTYTSTIVEIVREPDLPPVLDPELASVPPDAVAKPSGTS